MAVISNRFETELIKKTDMVINPRILLVLL